LPTVTVLTLNTVLNVTLVITYMKVNVFKFVQVLLQLQE